MAFSYTGPSAARSRPLGNRRITPAKRRSRNRSPTVAQRLPIPLRNRLRPLLGFCHLKRSGQPFETQLQTVWVSFRQQMRVTFAGPEGGSAKQVNDRSRPLLRRMARSLVTHSGEASGADEGSAVPVASKNSLAASTRKIALQHGHLNHQAK